MPDQKATDPERSTSSRRVPVSGEPHDPAEYCEVCRGYRDDPHECDNNRA